MTHFTWTRPTRLALGGAWLALLVGTAAAQRLEPSKLQPVRSEVKDAGVFDWAKKRWVAGPMAQQAGGAQPLQAKQFRTIYRNDCSWTGGTMLYTPEHCEDVISQGTVPAPDTPGAPLGATHDNQVGEIEFAYCTGYATGAVDIKVGFYDNLGGDCAGLAPVRPPSLKAQAIWIPPPIPNSTATAYFDFGSVSGYPLPGSTQNGKQGCWTMGFVFPNNGGFCMQSEGNGFWDNDASVDKFAWSFRSGNPKTVRGLGTGTLVAGEPATAGFGAGSYNLPLGSDAITGGACGTGAGTGFDHYWVNVDGSSPGVQNTIVQATGVRCKGAEVNGSNCYWFGGWPGAPLSAFWLVLTTNGNCDGCLNLPELYCTAGTSADGCVAEINATGTSRFGISSGFYLSASGVEGSSSGTNGLFYFGTNGRQASGWGNGTSFQCVTPPVSRTQVLSGGGTAGKCNASFWVDLNARWATKPSQSPGPGATVQAQLWYRDPGNTSNQTTSLSNAVEWTVCP